MGVVRLVVLAFDRERRYVVGDREGRGDRVLRGERVAGAQGDARAACLEGHGQVRRLRRHVEAARE